MARSDAWKMFLWTFQDFDFWKMRRVWKSLVFIVFLTMKLDPVLWKCSYGPWDHFRCSAKSVIWLVFYQSDSICFKNTWFSRLLYICKVPSCPRGKRLLFLWDYHVGKAFISLTWQHLATLTGWQGCSSPGFWPACGLAGWLPWEAAAFVAAWTCSTAAPAQRPQD